MRASNHPVANKRAFGQALARMKVFLPMDNWPESMAQLFFRGTSLSCGERLCLLRRPSPLPRQKQRRRRRLLTSIDAVISVIKLHARL
jgi:hypothetical protein